MKAASVVGIVGTVGPEEVNEGELEAEVAVVEAEVVIVGE